MARFREGVIDTYQKTLCMVQNSSSLLYKGFLTFFLLHELSALFSYFMQRISHRLLNEVSLRTLSLPEGAIPNLWYAVDRPEVMNFDTGYQQWSYVFFLVLLPLSALIRSLAAGATIYLCDRIRKQEQKASAATAESIPAATEATEDGKEDGTKAGEAEENAEASSPKEEEKPKVGWFGQVKASLGTIWSFRRQLGAIWLQLWIVEILVTIRVLPLEALSYVVVTLPFTLPRILNLQLAVTSAVKEGRLGNAALKRSAELVKGFRWPILVLLIGTLAAARVVEGTQTLILGVIPVRIFADIPEMPLLVSVAAYVANRIINRIRDILPFVAYELGREANGDGATAAEEKKSEDKKNAGQADGTPA